MKRLITTTIAVASAVALVPAAAQAGSVPRIGSGSKMCVLGPKATCKGVKARWGVKFHANLTEANLSKVKAGPPPGTRRRANATASCWPNCQGAQFTDSSLTYANLAGGNFTDASFELASLMHSTLSTAAAPGIYNGASFYDAGDVTTGPCTVIAAG